MQYCFETEVSSVPLFSLDLCLQVGDFQAEWKRCNLLANYFAEYVAYQFPRRERAENMISTIANELLEATISLSPPSSKLTFRCQQFDHNLRIDAEHAILPEFVSPFLQFVEAIRSDANGTLYYDLLTTEERPPQYFNQLGLLMLMHDFGALLKTRLDDTSGRICTQVWIPTKEFAE